MFFINTVILCNRTVAVGKTDLDIVCFPLEMFVTAVSLDAYIGDLIHCILLVVIFLRNNIGGEFLFFNERFGKSRYVFIFFSIANRDFP